MSNVLFEAAVRLRPETGGFAQEAQAEIQREVAQIQPPSTQGTGLQSARQDLNDMLANVRRMRVEADALVSSLTSGASSFGGAVNEAMTLIAEARKLTGVGEVDFAGTRLIEAKNLLKDLGADAPARALRDLAAAEDAVLQKSIDLNAVQRLQAQGFDEIATAGGRANSQLSPGRVGAYSAAIAVAYQGVQRLKEGLQQTGDEAFTTGGRIRNAIAAAVSGDVVGVFQALAAQESRLGTGLEKALASLKSVREEASRLSLQDVTDQSDRFEQEIADVTAAMFEMGIPLDQARARAQQYRTELELATAAARDNSKAVGEIEEAIKRAGSAAAAFGERETEFGRGVGSVTRSNALEDLSGGTAAGGEIRIDSDLPPGIRAALLREQGPGGTEAGLASVLRQAIANRERRLAEVLAQKPKTQELKNRQAEAVAAIRSDLNSFDQQLTTLLEPDDQPGGRRRAFQLPPRFIERQTAVLITERLSDDLKLANDILAFLERQKDVAKRGTDRFREVVAAIRTATADRQRILESIAQGREDAAADASEALRRTLGIREQRLQNALLEAQLTEAEGDDRRALVRLRDFYAAQSRNMKLAEEERLRFRQLELQTRARLRADTADSGGRVDIFAEAVKNFRQFGDNFSEGVGVLSAQDARGQLAALILRARNTAQELVQSVRFPDTDIGDKRFLNSLRGQQAVDRASPASAFDTASRSAAAGVSNPVVETVVEAERAQAQRDAQQLAATERIVQELRELRLGRTQREPDITGSVFGAAVGLARADVTHFAGRQ